MPVACSRIRAKGYKSLDKNHLPRLYKTRGIGSSAREKRNHDDDGDDAP
jgi:hypothetical protein